MAYFLIRKYIHESGYVLDRITIEGNDHRVR